MQTASGRPGNGGLKMFRALRRDGYRWFWFSGLGMTASQGIQQLAIAWLVLDLTDSVGQLGLVIFSQGVPMAIVSFYGGVLADRYERRRLLVLAQAGTMLNLLALALLSMSGMIEMWQVYASAVGLGIMQAITQPARTALIRSLVDDDDMTNGVALNAIQMHSSRILWPSVAGVLIAVAGIGSTLLLSAACSFGSRWMLLRVSNVTGSPTSRKRKKLKARTKTRVVRAWRTWRSAYRHDIISLLRFRNDVPRP